MSRVPRAAERMITGAAAVVVTAVLALSLSACRNGGLDSAPGTAPAPSAPSSTGAPTIAAAPDPSTASTIGVATDPSAALATASADLSGINAGASQADTDLGAGDSDRAKPDDPN